MTSFSRAFCRHYSVFPPYSKILLIYPLVSYPSLVKSCSSHATQAPTLPIYLSVTPRFPSRPCIQSCERFSPDDRPDLTFRLNVHREHISLISPSHQDLGSSRFHPFPFFVTTLCPCPYTGRRPSGFPSRDVCSHRA